MRPLEDTGKNGLTMADFSVMMVAVDLGPKKDQEDRLIFRSAVTALDSSLSPIRCATSTRVSTMTIHRRLIERNLCSYRPPPATLDCTLSSQITVVLGSIRLEPG
ncbi:hypothetical protein TNCV_3309711 [Trichonephila clavipes]|nr:hypothetical protein TNCV_3309711 [Trichonephila clavipes]